MSASWTDWIFGNLPLQPVQGDPVNPAYQNMPSSKNVDDRRAAAGPMQWASRPHDQDSQSYNLSGYYKPWNPNDLDAIEWQKRTGFLNRQLPTKPLPDPDYIPTDPSIVAHIRAAGDQAQFSPQQLQNMLQYWQAGRQ